MSRGFSTVKVAVLTVVAVAIAAIVMLTLFQPLNRPSAEYGHQESQTPTINYVIDFMGRNVTLPERVTRIVAIGPGALRLVCYLNALDLIVGVEESEITWGFTGRDYAMAYGELFRGLPVIGPGGPGKPPNPELILSVEPDLIIMSRSYAELYNPDELEKETKAKVVVVDYGQAGYLDVDGFAKALRMLGKALNKSERAEELISYVEGLVEDLRMRTERIEQRPKVYVGAVSYRGPQPFTATQTPFPPLTLLYTRSIADGYSKGSGFLSLDFEFLLKEQPEVIFIDEGNLNIVKQDFDKDPSKYLQLNAFREGNVYGILPYNYYHTNIAVALADAYYIGKVLYPKSFADLDPKSKVDEIFNAFLGRPLYGAYEEAYWGFKNLAEVFKVP
ncbi:MAG: ABC transporter substrate-binding protein [Candidatus Nezhaarchaeales archaeon]